MLMKLFLYIRIHLNNPLSVIFYLQVYIALFKPLRVSRRRFKKILSCLKTVRKLKCQEIYVQEKITKVDSLSLVLNGK